MSLSHFEMAISSTNGGKSKEDEDSVDGNGRETRFPPDCLRSMSEDISDWLGNMYEDVFESVFGSWLGNYSCPFASVNNHAFLC